MDISSITVEDLLAGSILEYDVSIPGEILNPGNETKIDKQMNVKIKPITIGVFQLILKASRDDAGLIPILLIKESLIAPELAIEEIKGMHVGLVSFLVEKIKLISGISEKKKS